MFNVIAYLDARGIAYKTTGKNVSAGWIGIQCVYPLCDDHSNHLGINLDTGVHSCWKCGNRGGPERLVELIDRVEWAEASDIVKRFSDNSFIPEALTMPRVRGDFMLPKFAQRTPYSVHAQYLQRRGYEPLDVVHKYDLLFTGSVSWVATPRGKIHYPWRIIMPIYVDGQIVNFTARDITGRATSKYKNGPDDIAIRNGGDCVYNIDRVRIGGSVMLVEGPLDVWRIGDGAVAMLGTQFTESQLSLIASRRPQRVFVVYDVDANEIARELGTRIARLVPETEYVWLTNGDPDGADSATIAYLRDLLF